MTSKLSIGAAAGGRTRRSFRWGAPAKVHPGAVIQFWRTVGGNWPTAYPTWTRRELRTRSAVVLMAALVAIAAVLVPSALHAAASTSPPPSTREGTTEAQQTVEPAHEPALDDLGQLLVFTTLDQLSSSDTNTDVDVYLRNRVTDETTLVSRRLPDCRDFSSQVVPCISGDAVEPAISDDGAYVAFTAFSDDIDSVYGPEGDASGCCAGRPRTDTQHDLSGKVFVWERATEAIRLASVDADGDIVSCLDDPANRVGSSDPAISATGRFVAFTTSCSPEADAADDALAQDVYRRDMASTTHNLSLVSLRCRDCGVAARDAVDPAISADGDEVVFASDADDFSLPSGETDENGFSDVYHRDMSEAVVTLVTRRGATQANGHSVDPDISGDGARVTFATTATNLFGPASCATAPTGDGCDASVGGNGPLADIALADRTDGTVTRVSRSDAGASGNFHSRHGRISTDGRYVAFLSGATNLVTDDTNNTIDCVGLVFFSNCTTADYDVFSHDSLTARTFRANVTNDGAQANGGSECGNSDRPEACAPSVNRNGRHVAFTSEATNLETSSADPLRDVFVHYAVLRISPPTLAFGDVAVGTTSGPRSLTVTNGASGPVRIGSVVLTGANASDFTIVTDGCGALVLYPDDNCTVSLQFRPTANGGRTARVVVSDHPLEVSSGTSSTSPNPPFSDLTGTGTAAAASDPGDVSSGDGNPRGDPDGGAAPSSGVAPSGDGSSAAAPGGVKGEGGGALSRGVPDPEEPLARSGDEAVDAAIALPGASSRPSPTDGPRLATTGFASSTLTMASLLLMCMGWLLLQPSRRCQPQHLRKRWPARTVRRRPS